jgi:hypothetical protein
VADLAGYREGYWLVDCFITTWFGLYGYAYGFTLNLPCLIVIPAPLATMHTPSLLAILTLYIESDPKVTSNISTRQHECHT